MKIPEYNSQVNAPGAANIRMSPNAPEAAFGVAVDTGAAVGKGLQNLAGVINEIEVKRQDDIDRAAVTAALSDYMKRSTDLMYNAENGFLNAAGKGAEGLTQRAEESYKTMEQDVRGQLKNKNQLSFFDRSIASHRANAGMNIMKHEVKALGEWRAEEAKNLEATTALTASKDLLNPAHMVTLTEVAALNARNKYGDQGDEQNVINTRKEMTSLIILSAGYAAADGRYDDAERFLDFNKDELDPVMYENAVKELKKQALPARAQEMAEKLFKENGIDGIETAREYVRDTFQGAEENAHMSALEGFYTDKKEEHKTQQSQVFDELYGKIRGRQGNFQSLQREISTSGLEKTKQWQLLDALDRVYRPGGGAGGGGNGGDARVKTDRDTWLKVQQMISDKTLLDDCPDWKTFTEKYGDKFSMTDLKDYYSIYKKADGSDEKNPAIKLSMLSTFNKYLDDAKIKDNRTRAIAIDRFNHDVNEAERAAKRTLSMEESITIMENTIKWEVVGYGGKGWNGKLKEIKKRAFELPPGAQQASNGKWYYPDSATGKWIEIF